MPRPIWTGAISFGLVTIPIRVVAATENRNIAFHQVHLEDMARVRTKKVCDIDGQELGRDDIGRGYEVSKDTIVEITDAELDSMPLPTAKAIDIVAFVAAETIDPVRVGAGYYLEAAGQVAAKPYKLLRMALERSSKVAVAKFAWHNRERLGLLRVKDNAIVLHAMHWDDEIRSPEALAPKAVELTDDEVDAAIQLLETMARDDIDDYTDHYREAVEEMLTAKAEHRRPKPVEGEAPEQAGKVVDLMAALTASMESAKAARGETGDATVHDLPKKRAAKKAPAKKTAAKKTAAKKATAKKAASRKPRSA
ncbi:non-homologous end joining protein Ku [Streptomyces xanthochromogenes]|uniref:non-homologous end joining protein Ku n=1 Tax=Streptomyces xanthochromogenes TaxID=67384 RepID=UPI001676A490|nr:Ku protein [Streptomyces xanthochromogenes]GHB55268.1 non-homologous end joining protein Ku [Streptomyces xanthochromogenes]